MGIQFDGSINVGQIINVVAMVASFLCFIVYQSASWAKHGSTLENLGTRMINVEVEMKKQTEILITLGHQEARIGAQEGRFDGFEKRLDSYDKRIAELTDKLGLVQVQHAIDAARAVRETDGDRGQRSAKNG